MLADGQTGYRKRRYLPFDVEPDREAALRGSGFSNETNCGQSEDRRKHTSGFFFNISRTFFSLTRAHKTV